MAEPLQQRDNGAIDAAYPKCRAVSTVITQMT